MHPILARRRSLGIYLAAWIPFLALIRILLIRSGGLQPEVAVGLAAPLALIYAFICLAAWYVCRAAPIAETPPLQLLGTQMLAGAISSGVWVSIGSTMAAAVQRMKGTEVVALYGRQRWLLFSVGLLVFLLAAAVHYVLVAVEQSREAQTRVLRLQVLAREAELKALRAQVNPHFLFNSLNSISALTSTDAAGARRMCQLLGEFLRLSLKAGARDVIGLTDEMALVRQYLAIEQIRFGRRLAVAERLKPEAAGCEVPSLLLQPLVENAVRHGIAQLVDGGSVEIVAERRGETIHVRVSNPRDGERSGREGAGLGLDNVRQRLATRYGNQSRVDVDAGAEHYAVMLSWPARVLGE